MAANPKRTNHLRLDEEEREIKNGLQRSKNREHFIISSIWAVRIRDLRRALLDGEPNIVHFMGHGTEEALIIEDDSGEKKEVYSQALSNLFKLSAKHLEIVVLNACYSKYLANIISTHINYVIGMKQEINDRAAIEFSVGFYDALGAGRDVKEAFEYGCNAIQLFQIPEEMIPILIEKTAPGPGPGPEISEKKGDMPPRYLEILEKVEVIPTPIGFLKARKQKELFFILFASVVIIFSVVFGVNQFRGTGKPDGSINTEVTKPTTHEKKDQKNEHINKDSDPTGKKIPPKDQNQTHQKEGEDISKEAKSASKNNKSKGVKSINSTLTRQDHCNLPEIENDTGSPPYPTKTIIKRARGKDEEEAFLLARKEAVWEFFHRCPEPNQYKRAVHRIYKSDLRTLADNRVEIEIIIEFYKKMEEK